MEFLYFLESIRNPLLDFFFSVVTLFGEETFFLVIAIVFFWCVDKRTGYYILITGLIGTVVNQALKLAFRIPRPWNIDKNFTIVESAREAASGYSFPSGHTQNVAGTFGAVGASSKKRRVSVICVVLIVLVAFSRMYLGVHTPLDVCVSLLIAAVLLAVLYPVFTNEERFHKFMPYIATVSMIMSIGLVLFTFLTPDGSADAANLASARENACKLLGCTVCLAPVYYLDRFCIKFDTRAPWYAQILKALLGLLLLLALKEGLKYPLLLLFDNVFVSHTVRYAAVVLFAGILWPMTFRFFGKIKISCLDKLFKKKG